MISNLRPLKKNIPKNNFNTCSENKFSHIRKKGRRAVLGYTVPAGICQ